METGTENNQEQKNAVPENAVSSLLSGLVDTKTIVELQEIDNNKFVPEKEQKNEKKVVSKAEDQQDENESVDDEQEEDQEDVEENEESENEEEADENNVSDKKSDKKEDKSDKKEQAELKNKFGIKLGKKEDKKSDKIDIKSFDELPSVLKSKYGQEIKDVKALPKFLETVDKWRSDSQNLEKVTKEKDNAIAVFENLPSELLEAVKMHYSDGDYRKALEQSPKIDYSKSVDKHKPKDLVNVYFPGEFTDEDFEADEPSRELKIAIKASEKEYNSEKIAREQRAKNRVEQEQRKSEAYKTSIKSSVTALKSAFPDILPDVEADVEHTLSSGALMSEFFNPDGTYKPQAAEMFMLAKHGKELIEELMQIAQLRGESKANEEIVRRSADKPKSKKSGDKTAPIRKEVTEEIDNLLPKGLVQKNVF